MYRFAELGGKMVLNVALLDKAHNNSDDRLGACTVLVWSEARIAEGEKGNQFLLSAYAL